MSRIRAGQSSRRSAEGSGRIDALVAEKLDAGLNYEAMQLYRGQGARKAARGRIDDAAAVLEAGVGVLLGKGFAGNATELSVQMVDMFRERQVAVTEDRTAQVLRLNDMYDKALEARASSSGGGGAEGAEEEGKKEKKKKKSTQEASSGNGKGDEEEEESSIEFFQSKFLKAAVEWATKIGERVQGEPKLNFAYGMCLAKRNKVELALKYLVSGEAPEAIVQLMETAGAGQGQPKGRMKVALAVRGILGFLCLRNMRDANKLFHACEDWADKKKAPALMLFCGCLLEVCEFDARAEFQELCERFQGALSADDKLQGYLRVIGQRYFGIVPPKSMLATMLSGLGLGG